MPRLGKRLSTLIAGSAFFLAFFTVLSWSGLLDHDPSKVKDGVSTGRKDRRKSPQLPLGVFPQVEVHERASSLKDIQNATLGVSLAT